MLIMNNVTNEAIIRSAIADSLEIMAENAPRRSKCIKSTFNVSPEDYHLLELICRLTGKTKQEIYTDALRQLLRQRNYLDDIPINQNVV